MNGTILIITLSWNWRTIAFSLSPSFFTTASQALCYQPPWPSNTLQMWVDMKSIEIRQIYSVETITHPKEIIWPPFNSRSRCQCKRHSSIWQDQFSIASCFLKSSLNKVNFHVMQVVTWSTHGNQRPTDCKVVTATSPSGLPLKARCISLRMLTKATSMAPWQAVYSVSSG